MVVCNAQRAHVHDVSVDDASTAEAGPEVELVAVVEPAKKKTTCGMPWVDGIT